eukprot:Gb_40377 [translate_table: standard]
MEVAWICWECLERLILVVALQLAAVAYGVNSFSKPLEDLESCMVKLLECLRNPQYRIGIVTGVSSDQRLREESIELVEDMANMFSCEAHTHGWSEEKSGASAGREDQSA